MGAVKCTLYKTGEVLVYVYGDRGASVVNRTETSVTTDENEILWLAVTLRNEADDKGIWDASIEKICTDTFPEDVKIEEFEEDNAEK